MHRFCTVLKAREGFNKIRYFVKDHSVNKKQEEDHKKSKPANSIGNRQVRRQMSSSAVAAFIHSFSLEHFQFAFPGL